MRRCTLVVATTLLVASGVSHAIDVVDLAASDFRFQGQEVAARAGSAVGSARGFFGGTGNALVIGAYLADPFGNASAGASYVFDIATVPGEYGLDQADYTLLGQFADDRTGFSVGGGGDVNDDGIPDLIVGGWSVDGSGTLDAGGAFVVFGRGTLPDSALTGDADLTIIGQESVDHLGWSVDISGDINGDDVNDIIVGVPLGQGGGVSSGEVFVFFGGSDLVSGLVLDPDSADLHILATEVEGGAGHAVATGDLNGDGIDDLVIGMPNKDEPGRFNTGVVYVVRGRTSFSAGQSIAIETGYDLKIIGEFDRDNFGFSLAVVPDLDLDGKQDLLVGAPFYRLSGNAYVGRLYVFRGRTLSTPSTLDARTQAQSRIDGQAAGDFLSYSIAVAGDINGGGRTDFVVGAPGTNLLGRDSAGAAFLFMGEAGIPPSGAAFTVGDRVYVGAADGDEAGASVAGVYDFNGDGSNDLAIGAPGADAPAAIDAGAVHVVIGDPMVSVPGTALASVLGAAFPNPTAGAVAVPVHLPEGSRLDAIVTDAQGRLVRRLSGAGAVADGGLIRWDGASDSGRPVAPGLYFVAIESERGRDTRRVTVVR